MEQSSSRTARNALRSDATPHYHPNSHVGVIFLFYSIYKPQNHSWQQRGAPLTAAVLMLVSKKFFPIKNQKGAYVDMLNFILQSPEVRGWHSGTAIAVMINLLTLYQAAATIGQVRRIFADKSTSGISAGTMAYFAFYFLAFLVYGIHKGALTMVGNALQFLIYIPLLIGLWKYGNKETRRTIRSTIPVFALLPVIMVIIPWKGPFFLMLLCGILITQWLMHQELRRADGVGSFEIMFAYAFLMNAIFWFLYALSLRDIPLMIFNPIAAILITMTILLYFKKKRLLRTQNT